MASNVKLTGLVAWATEIRLSMSKDPGRQQLEDDIQMNGFLWLDEYLENILADHKQEPLIELVKTPGRKKEAPKKTRAATAAAAKMRSFMDAISESAFANKENTPSRATGVMLKSPQALSPRRDPLRQRPEPQRNINIPILPSLPSLPALHKSTRDPSLNHTTVAPVLPSRTSWLVKARDARYNDDPKRISAFGQAATPAPPQFASKRKSDAMAGVNEDEVTRDLTSKALKQSNDADVTRTIRWMPGGLSIEEDNESSTSSTTIKVDAYTPWKPTPMASEVTPVLPTRPPTLDDTPIGTSVTKIKVDAYNPWKPPSELTRVVPTPTLILEDTDISTSATKIKVDPHTPWEPSSVASEVTPLMPPTPEDTEITTFATKIRVDIPWKPPSVMSEVTPAIPTPTPVQDEAAEPDSPTGILALLRKRVESFSSKNVKNGSKSLGGAAATAAAEAKAAAEARLAQRQAFIPPAQLGDESTSRNPSGSSALQVHAESNPVMDTDETGKSDVKVTPTIPPQRSTTPLSPPPQSRMASGEQPMDIVPPSPPSSRKAVQQVKDASDSQDAPISMEITPNFEPVQHSQATQALSSDFDIIEENLLSSADQDGDTESDLQSLESKVSSSQFSSQFSVSVASQGILGHASAIMQKAFGSSKKGKPEVKSIQLAAAAAKKQQEEAEKKTIRLKEMESRRQLVLQRKQEEERSRAAEIDKKNKEDAERRRKEREEADRRAKILSKKAQLSDDESKKRPPSRLAKPAFMASQSGIQLTASTSGLAKSVKPPLAAAPTPAPTANVPTIKLVPSSSNLKSQPTFLDKSVVVDKPGAPPTVVVSQASRQTKVFQATNVVSTEHIELPDIDSEYSDENDHVAKLAKKKAAPEWTQSPELARALAFQSTINPDHIFGAIMPLRMDEMFKSKQGRFRNRTSSANWVTAGDLVTAEEEQEYARRMGFTQ